MKVFNFIIFLETFYLFKQCNGLYADNLRVESLKETSGVGKIPHFSWILTDLLNRAQEQTAYQIIVSTTQDHHTGVLWDTGKVLSAMQMITYEGDALIDDSRYYWCVRVWDRMGHQANDTSFFSTGLFTQARWHGEWITGGDVNNQLRKKFTIKVPIDADIRASVFISGIGYYELFCNGKRVGNHHLDVGWTKYEKRIYYSSFDISEFVILGSPNVFSVTLGNGWWACAGNQPGCRSHPPQLRLQANIYHKIEPNSEKLTLEVVSDLSWKSFAGPIVFNSLYGGEHYDARKETTGWKHPDYDDSQWLPVILASSDTKSSLMSSQLFPPIRMIGTLQPISVAEPKPGVYVVDFGQNLAGWTRIRIPSGPHLRGKKVTLRHAEVLMHMPYGPADGTIYTDNLGAANATDIYIMKGTSVPGAYEEYEPRFTQHGFRYCQITGLDTKPTSDNILAVEVHSDVYNHGNIIFSNNLLNKIQHAVIWGQKSNLMSLPTDCDNRDERLGWMGDAALIAEEALLNFEVDSIFSGWLRSIVDAQYPDGSVPNTVPDTWNPGKGGGDPNWQSAYPTITHALLYYTGNLHITEEHYLSLKKYIDFMNMQYSKTGLAKFGSWGRIFGDWVPPYNGTNNKADDYLVSAFSYIRDLRLLKDLAIALGRDNDAAVFSGQIVNLVQEFNDVFYNTNNKTYGKGLQTEQALALWLDAPDPSNKQYVLNYLVDDIMNTNKIHTTCGIIGWKYLLEALSLNDRTDVALAIALQETFPSIGYMIQGAGNPEPATTLWELWHSDNGPADMDSRNHIMFGTISAWFYKALAGISLDSTRLKQNGKLNIKIAPTGINIYDLTFVEASTNTPQGPLFIRWDVDNNSKQLFVNISIPFGALAHFYAPIVHNLGITSSNIYISESENQKWKDLWKYGRYTGGVAGVYDAYIDKNKSAIIILIGSGNYYFKIQSNETIIEQNI